MSHYAEWVEILTPRLRLRGMTREDGPDVYELRSFDEVWKWRFVALRCHLISFVITIRHLPAVPVTGARRFFFPRFVLHNSSQDFVFLPTSEILMTQSLTLGHSVRPKWNRREEADDWISQRLSKLQNFQYVIEPLDASALPPNISKVIGTTGLVDGHQLGYQFHPGVWGRGYATEALRAFIPFLCSYPEHVAVDELRAWVSQDNRRSIKVLEKIGFVKEQVWTGDVEADAAGNTESDAQRVELSVKERQELRQSVEEMGSPGTGRKDLAWPTDGKEAGDRATEMKLLVYVYNRKKKEP